MAKYDSQLSELKNKLPGAQNVLIALPTDANLDEMASGSALFLALQSHGKAVQIVSDKLPQVAQANLYGVGSIKNTVAAPSVGTVVPTAQPASGDYTLVLEGVANPQGTVPSLEKLDWYAENSNLNLVFHTLPGQSFQPRNIYPKTPQIVSAAGGSGAFDLVFVIGGSALNALGSIYTQNQQSFSGVHIVNIDRDPASTSFGQTNVVDGSSSSIAEILADIIPVLGLPFDRDIATNLLAGIFDMTGNLSSGSIGPDTYVAVGNCLKVGGQKPLIGAPVSTPVSPVAGFQTPVAPASTTTSAPMMDFSAFLQPQPLSQPTIQPAPIPTFNDLMNQQAQSKPEETFTIPPIASVLPNEVVPQTTPPAQPVYQASSEERPAGERVVTDSPEPGWLTPKVFKGTSVG